MKTPGQNKYQFKKKKKTFSSRKQEIGLKRRATLYPLNESLSKNNNYIIREELIWSDEEEFLMKRNQ